MIGEDLKPRDVLTRASFENALVVQMALAGSTNAIIHLIAMAGRAGIDLAPRRFRPGRARRFRCSPISVRPAPS